MRKILTFLLVVGFINLASASISNVSLDEDMTSVIVNDSLDYQSVISSDVTFNKILLPSTSTNEKTMSLEREKFHSIAYKASNYINPNVDRLFKATGYRAYNC